MISPPSGLSRYGRVRAFLVSVLGLLAVGIMVPSLAAPSFADDFPDLTEALEARDFATLYETLLDTPEENSGLDGPMGWLRANLDATDARFSALLAEKIFPHDPGEALRLFYLSLAWAFQDAAECTDGTALGAAVRLLSEMPQLVDYAREHPEEDIQAFAWGLDRAARNPSPSNAVWVCTTGIDVALALGRQEKVDAKDFLYPAEGRRERRETVLADLRQELETRRQALANAKPSGTEGPSRTKFNIIETEDGFHVYETGLVTGFEPEVYFGPNNEVLFHAIDTPEIPKGTAAYQALSRKETTERITASEVAAAQAGKRLWDIYIWHPGEDTPKILYDGSWVSYTRPYEEKVALKIGCEMVLEGTQWCAQETVIVGLPDHPEHVSRETYTAASLKEPGVPPWVTERFPDTPMKSYMDQTGDLFIGTRAPNKSIYFYRWYDRENDKLVVPTLKRDGNEFRICGLYPIVWLSWMQAYQVSECVFDDNGYFVDSVRLQNCAVSEVTYSPGGVLEYHCFDNFPDTKHIKWTHLVPGGLISLNSRDDHARLLIFHPIKGGAYLLDHGNIDLPLVSPDGCIVTYGYSAKLAGWSRTSDVRATLRAVNLCKEGQ